MECERAWLSSFYWLKALARDGVLAAQESPAHAAVDDVVPGRVGQGHQGGAGAGHVKATERSYSVSGAMSRLPGQQTVSAATNAC